MATARDIIRLAFKDAQILGQGQSLLSEDAADGFTTLNQMIAQWRRKRWMVYRLEELSVVSTGAQFYTIGPATAVPTPDIICDPLPERLEYAFNRQLVNSTPNQADYTLRILESREDYSSIVMKGMGNFPYCIWYDYRFPVGRIYPYPVPQSALYEVFVLVKQPLAAFANPSDTVNLPPEYEMALRYQLAVLLCPSYGRDAPSGLIRNAKNAMLTIRGANAQIKRLTMPAELLRPSVYNPYSDQVQ